MQQQQLQLELELEMPCEQAQLGATAAAEEPAAAGLAASPASRWSASGPAGAPTEPSVCHLTARTSDNQCAIHRARSPSPASGSAANAQQLGQLGQPSGGQSPINAKRADGAQVSRANGSDVAGTAAAAGSKLAAAAAPGQRQLSRTRRRRSRGRRLRRLRGEHDVASWPLARRTLGANCCFGDAEDMSGPWRLGRPFQCASHCPALDLGANGGANGGGGGGGGDKDGYCCADDCSAHAQPSNYSHRRPFGQSFERPTTGWLYNATAPHKINLPRASAVSLRGK